MEEIKLTHQEVEELSTVFNSIPAWVFQKDTENNFIRVNDTYCRVLKIDKNQIEGKSAFNIYPRDQALAFWRDDREVIQSGLPKLNIIEKAETPDGARWVRTDKIPFRDSHGVIAGVIGFAVDITEIKKSEAEAIDTHRFLKKLIETAPTPIFYKDINGVYRGCNEAFAQYLGKEKEEIIGKSVYDLCPKDLADKYSAMDKALFDEVSKQTYEYKVKYADGTRHDVIFNKATYTDANGKPAGLIGVMVDITDRKKAEAEISMINAMAVDRELKMMELKKKINDLEAQLANKK